MSIDPDSQVAAREKQRHSTLDDSASRSLRWWHIDLPALDLWRARVNGERGRVAVAEELYRRVLARHPVRLPALTGLASLLMRQKRFGEALPLWQRAVSARPDNSRYIFQLARALHRYGRLEEALEQYLNVVAIEPEHEKALSAVGEIAGTVLRAAASGNSGSRARATSAAKRLSALGTAPALFASAGVARIIAAQGRAVMAADPAMAVERFEEALDLCPGLAEALAGLAVCFERLGKFENAIANLEKQLELDPEAVGPRQQLDRICAQLQPGGAEGGSSEELEDDAARERRSALTRAQQLAATLSEVKKPVPAVVRPVARASAAAAEVDRLLRSARSAYNGARTAEAEARYRDVLAIRDGNVEALISLSRLYVRERRFDDAIPLLTRLQALQPRSSDAKEMLAQAYWQKGQIVAAGRLYADLTSLEPDRSDIFRNLGRARSKLGEWTAARSAWMRVCELEPERNDARLELALACHNEGLAEQAETELQRVLGTEPDSRAALRLLGRIRQPADPEGALAAWTRVAELEPDKPEPVLQTARLHLRLGHAVEAEAAFRRVLSYQPGNSEALTSLVRIVAERDPAEGLSLLSAWRDQSPEDVAPVLAIAQQHVALKQLELAEAAFVQARQLAPDDRKVLMALGRFYSTHRRLDAALPVWSELVELAPDLIEPKLQLARLHHLRRDPGVEALLESVLRAEPEHREALRLLAQHYGRTASTVDRALEVWEHLAQLDPASAVPVVHRGRLLEGAGRLDEAEAELRRGMERDPSHPMVLADLARFYRVRRRYDEAIEIYQAHLHLEPNRMDIILGLGQSFDRLNRLQEAQEFYERALALEPDNVTALGYRGRLLRTRGQVDAAIADFRRICSLDPGNTDAWHELIFQLAGAEHVDEALAAVAEAEAALGPTARACITLARACAAALFDRQAVQFFERAIAAEPENAAHRAQFGLYYFRQGILDGALQHLLDSRDLDPRNVQVARALFDVTNLLRELGFDHLALRRGPRTAGEILSPERLFGLVRRIADPLPPYEPVPRRVVAISATLAPGGAERQLVTLLRGLVDPGFDLELSLFCTSLSSRFRRDFFLPALDGTGVEIVVPDVALTADYLAAPEVAPFARIIRHFPPDMIGPIAFWLGEFKHRKPEVVHAWQDLTCLMAVVAALLAGVPRIVLCCRSVRPDNPRRRLRRFMRDAYMAVLSHPSVVLSNNSQAGADDYAEWLEIDPARIEVVYNGIDFDRLAASANAEETQQARSDLGIPDDAPVVGGVFRMSEEKRPLLWLDVAANVAARRPDAHFVVCGDGPMRDEMRTYAAGLGIADRVHLPGAQSNIGSWFKLMDVVMLTSRHEGLPNVLLEAQSLGVPVVAPDVGGVAEVIEQGLTGWAVRDADAASLAERVLYSLTDAEWRRAAIDRAPGFVRERFGIAIMLRRNLDVYDIR